MTWGITIDETHDPNLRSWVASANDPETPFPIQNLPIGIFRRRHGGENSRGGIAIGNQVLDLARCVELGLLNGEAAQACCGDVLNPLLELGCERWSALRLKLSRLLREGATAAARADDILVSQDDIELGLPIHVGDYSDFFASIHHARRTGRIIRGHDDVSPNYRHLPIAYHGRASSIIVSGTPVRRPNGLRLPQGAAAPDFGPTERLDFELELAAIIGDGNALRTPIPVAEAHRHLFGLCLMNDWSARDIQAFEAMPLGPFLGKSFATSISGWIVMMGALAPFRAPLENRAEGDPPPAAHLVMPEPTKAGVEIELFAAIQTAERARRGDAPVRIVSTHFRHLYWSFEQMLAHQTSNGCNVRSGDLLGSGTVSGPTDESAACLLELSEAGRRPLTVGEAKRTFLEDGDEIILSGWCRKQGYRAIGLGPSRGAVEPAMSMRETERVINPAEG